MLKDVEEGESGLEILHCLGKQDGLSTVILGGLEAALGWESTFKSWDTWRMVQDISGWRLLALNHLRK